MKTGTIATMFILTAGIALIGEANANQASEAAVAAIQTETAVDQMRIKNPEVKELLKSAFRKMRAADEEIQAFAKRKESQKVKEGFWAVSEECETNNVTEFLRADFFSETGPVRFGAKSVYQDKTHQKEIKAQRFQLYYHENGKVKVFLTVGDPAITLEFYPSGRVKQFCLSSPDNTTIAAFDGGDDDSIKHEVYNGSKSDKDKTGKP